MNITSEYTISQERIDDIPLLLTQLEKMGVQKLIDEYFPTHGNWQGLSLGWVLVVWLCHIISQQDHRLSYVQPWVGKRLETLKICTEQFIKELDFSDDRLEASLRYLSQDKNWLEFEGALGGNLLQVYDLSSEKVRVDSTTASSYCGVNEEGLFQWGHSKDYRPDLRQAKIMLSTLDPMGMPIATEVVAGNSADDPLYIPAVHRVKETLNKSGLLIIGDCKMAALQTRAEIVRGGDYYLCPLSAKQVNEEELKQYVLPVWQGKQPTTDVEYDYADGKREIVARGYQKLVPQSALIKDQVIDWTERHLVVRSLKAARREELALRERLAKAQSALSLLETRRGKKRLRTLEDWQEASAEIIKRYRVQGLLQLNYQVKSETRSLRKYGNRPACVKENTSISIKITVNETAVCEAIYLCGWRVYATNHPSETFSLNDAVVAYRDSYLMERSFSRLKNSPLSLTPIYLQRDDHIKGLIRLLSIGLRVLTLLEWVVRRNLNQQQKSLKGLYPGNPQRATKYPTAEKLLAAFAYINLVFIVDEEQTLVHLNPLNTLQQEILALLDFSRSIYTRLDANHKYHTQPP